MKSNNAAIRLVNVLLVFALALFISPLPGVKATPVSSQVVINEIDYDQPSTDNAEFVEIMNNSPDSINLDNYALQMINGASGGALQYGLHDLPNVELAAGDFYVVCASAATVLNCDLDVSPDSGMIQNGSPDAVALLLNGGIIDTVSYGGDTAAPYTEGSGSGLIDPATASMGISRCPDGTDTDQNNVDFTPKAITPGAANSCPPPPLEIGTCEDPATAIHEVQGSGSTSPLLGQQRILQGVVVGDFRSTANGLSGFFLQEEDSDADADPLTSEGIFIYDNGIGVDVNAGDVVRVLGDVAEFSTLTELSNASEKLVCSTGAAVTPAAISLPVSALSDWEPLEGMLVNIPQTLYATENYDLGRYGEVELSVGSRLFAPTQIAAPGAPALAVQDLNNRSRIQLDDGSNVQNPLPLPPYLGLGDTLRAGDTLAGLTGVLSYSHGSYEIHPTQTVSFTRVNNRPAAPPAIGGLLKVASFNVLNYFTTLDMPGNLCGPAVNLECRGADTPAEFDRQRAKILAALVALDPDIAGLIEVENNATAAIQNLVDGLNAVVGTGTYNFINSGTIGTDAIKVALIYKTARVAPAGPYAILDSSVDPTFQDTRNRPSLAQTFETPQGGRVTVVVNHFKSKGSACADDPDTGDGQGNCNLTRTAAAVALSNWLAGDPTGGGDPDFLILGDLNAYAQEDPLDAIKTAGYSSLSDDHLPDADAYSYVFEGAAGELDHALASASLAAQVLNVGIWHINADEPVALDYNQEFNQPLLYHPDAYRSSDHDPLVVILDTDPPELIWMPILQR